ncbi:hypothetical protein [Bradyrhizobium sp. SYSU BS000235]|uniref:hypothetical protein n=1 Tax=Bradyrhizobium sp. SYSU BS000235 TaxID=3411332 RepID=UPI003C7350DE
MSDMFSILQSNYKAVGAATYNRMPYVNVDPTLYQGTWDGAYADGTKFKIQISNVTGFRAQVRYQSGSVHSNESVLINANSFKFGTSKFTLTKAGTAEIKTVNETKGTLETANATQDIPPGG